MAHGETYRFEFVDGTAELVAHGSVRYHELLADGHSPVGSVPASDGISDGLESWIDGRLGANVATTDTAVAGAVTSGPETTAALSATIEPVRVAPFRAAGAVTISWDDAWATWHSNLMPRLRDTYRTQRHTFCLTPGQLDTTGVYMTTAQFMELHETLPHCEIASHSQTHANMASSSIAARVAEYEDSADNIEALIGERPTSFVYPFGTSGSNDTTHAELWGRYERIVNAGIQPGGSITPMDQRLGMFLTPRPIDWNSTTHQQMLRLVRMAASQPIIANIYSHKPGEDMTLAELDELLTLCDTLGVPVINIRDAYPGGGLIPNAFAEGSGGWSKIGAGTFDVVTDTMQAGIPGSASFHLNVAATTDYVYATHTAFAVEGQHFTFSGRARKTYSATQVPAYTRLRMVPLSKTGVSLAAPIESANAGDAWGQIKAEGTMPAGTAMVRLDLIQLGAAGDSWFSHLHFGPTRWGVMG